MNKRERIMKLVLACTIFGGAVFGTTCGLLLNDRLGFLIWGSLFFAQCTFQVFVDLNRKRDEDRLHAKFGREPCACEKAVVLHMMKAANVHPESRVLQ